MHIKNLFDKQEILLPCNCYDRTSFVFLYDVVNNALLHPEIPIGIEKYILFRWNKWYSYIQFILKIYTHVMFLFYVYM
jgi:hypothetical protein